MFRAMLILLVALSLTACVNRRMQFVDVEKTNYSLRPDRALIVVMRNTNTQSSRSATLFEIVDEEPIFLAILSEEAKFAFHAKPGHHRFMIMAGNANFLDADLKAGKAYYVHLNLRIRQAFRSYFTFKPLLAGDS